MALPHKIESKEDIPAGAEEHYLESGGAWFLEVTGLPADPKVKEFRDSNIALKAELDKFAGITPERAAELLEKAEQLDNFEAKGEDKIKLRVEAQTAAMKQSHEVALAAEKARADRADAELQRLTIDGLIVKTGSELGLRPTAVEDATGRARTTWRLENGTPVAYKDGEKVYGKDGTNLSMKEWMEGLSKTAPHLFDASQGASGGSAGGGSGGGGGGGRRDPAVNPWKDETWNMTQQAAIVRNDIETARRLAAAAGKPVNF